MAGDLNMPDSFSTKAEMYAFIHEHLGYHLEAVSSNKKFDATTILTMGLANASSLLFYALNTFHSGGDAKLSNLLINWVGFYIVSTPQYLALGPFQGKVACTQIKMGKGVCGTAALLGKVQCVPNVHEFPGHIACDGGSLSEIVVPIRNNEGQIVAVLDIDSTQLSSFDAEDTMRLTEIVVLISKHLQFPSAFQVRSEGIAMAQMPSVPIPATSMTSTTSRTISSTNTTATATAAAIRTSSGSSDDSNKLIDAMEAVKPEVRVRHVGSWQITCSRLDRIASCPELTAWEVDRGLSCLPEIIFPHNVLNLTFKNPNSPSDPPLVLSISAVDYFLNATSFKSGKGKGEVIHRESKGAHHVSHDALLERQSFLQIPASEGWKNNKYDVFDPSIDWAFRGDFVSAVSGGGGVGETAATFKPVNTYPAGHFAGAAPGTCSIDYEMLKRQDMEILFYDTFCLFEDDLHDAGVSKCTVKFRVMETCIFVLIRHVVRVDQAGAVCRDVRLFHKFSRTREHRQTVVAEVSYKYKKFDVNVSALKSQLSSSPLSPQQQTKLYESLDTSILKIPLDALVEKMDAASEPEVLVLEL